LIKTKYILPLLFFLLLASKNLQAQLWSIPYITNYSPKQYEAGSDNWAIIQDKRGIMYFANTSGILIYDGTRWEQYPVKNMSSVRSLALGDDGRIFVGAIGDFGYLKPGNSGKLQYVSLVDLLPEHEKEFSEVWKTYVINDIVYFQTFEKVFVYQNDRIEEIIYPEKIFHLSFKVDNEIWIIDRGIGLKKIRDKKISMLQHGEMFATDKIYGIIPFGNKQYLLATFNDNLQLFNPFTEKTDSILLKFNTPAEEYFNAAGIYNTILLDDNSFAVGTLSGGVVILDKSGVVKNVFCKSNGLQDEAVYFMYIDKSNLLWIGLSKGISKIEYSSPISWFNDVSGINGKIQCINFYQGKLYVATSQGLYVQRNYDNKQPIKNKKDVDKYINRFQLISQIATQCWYLFKTSKGGADDKLYVASNKGIFVIDGEKINQISNFYCYSLCVSEKDPNILYAGTINGLAVLKKENGQWKELGNFDGISGSIRSVIEDINGDIWMGIPFEGVSKISFNPDNANLTSLWGQKYSIEKFDSTSGLTDFRYDIVFKSDSDIYVGTFIGLFNWDFKNKRFKKEERFGKQFSDGTRQVYFFTKGFDNTYWFFNANEKLKETGVVTFKNNIPQWYNTPFKRFSGSQINYIYITPDRRVWFGGPDGLIIFNSKSKKNYNSTFYNRISKITIGKDSLLFGGNFVSEDGKLLDYQTEDLIKKHEYKFNSFVFEFSALSYENEKSNSYKWFLEGYDSDWSNWTSESKVSYTNLPEGNYTFRLKSKNVYDIESEETTYSFVILPPWYRTIYAYIAYVLIFIGFVYGAIQLSIYRLKRSKAQLELIVQERTAEIVKQKEEIEIQKELVEEKNKDITDSINYASRIQQAILPIMDEIKKVLPESFVFYRPRDIVSGDFYWFVKKGKDVYIAAADCTGHGVPGAFMSMIGHTLLNEILNQKNITSTGEILTELHKQIRISLKQDLQESRDGMDIALCKLNIETYKLEYSGAMRPLYVISDGELKEVKADKFPIGGFQEEEEVRVFNTNEIQLKKGDLFYVFSDGYADQFGGPEGKKFMVKRLKELLIKISPYDMDYQYNEVVNNFLEWLGTGEQIDDILVIGVRV
jgi:serine phosphatase RsbU (regulator of sigma subunit)/ligand-binding sensor domain-containing protein